MAPLEVLNRIKRVESILLGTYEHLPGGPAADPDLTEYMLYALEGLLLARKCIEDNPLSDAGKDDDAWEPLNEELALLPPAWGEEL